MATTYEVIELFNEPQERLCENLLAHLNKPDHPLETHWAAVHADEYTLANGQNVRQVWGLTNAYASNDLTRFIHFLVKLTAISPGGTEVQVTSVSPYPQHDSVHLGEGDETPALSAGAVERKRLEKIADRVLEFCANPQAETDTGLVGWFRKLLAQSKAKRKSDNTF